MVTTKIRDTTRSENSYKGKGNMLQGLRNHSPKSHDASTVPPRGNVNDDAVRSGVAATPKTLGPRNA